MLKNKHLMIATLMAPVLALIAYFGIGHLVGEKPHAAEPGQSYLLVEKPNCRYESGHCGLKNGDFELELNFERNNHGRLLLKLKSENPLSGVMLALVESGDETEQPEAMLAVGSDGLNWSHEIEDPDPARHRLHLVAASGESLYYGDAATKFTLAKSE
jgi:hypothetical protein